MRVVRTVGGLVLLSVLAGCVSPEEQHAADQQRCYGYGFQPGTDQFAHCMMHVDQQREAQEAADAWARDAQAAADARAQAAKQTTDGGHTSDSGMPDMSDMKCTSNTTTTGSDNDSVTKTSTNCHN